MRKFRKKREIHGYTGTRLYKIWQQIIDRCYNVNNSAYKWYGKKGIKVYSNWQKSFLEFKNWAEKNNYNNNLTIERKNVKKGYFPSNCEWIPFTKQNYNKTNSIKINGVPLMRLCEIHDIDPYLVRRRLADGWKTEDIFKKKSPTKLKFPGVSFEKSIYKIKKPWRMRYGLNGKVLHGGNYSTESEAYRAYLKIKKKYGKINEKELLDKKINGQKFENGRRLHLFKKDSNENNQ